MECPNKAPNRNRDISLREWTVIEGNEAIRVREIGSETAQGMLRYRAELHGSAAGELAVIDAFSADDLAEMLPFAISCFVAANRLRRRL